MAKHGFGLQLLWLLGVLTFCGGCSTSPPISRASGPNVVNFPSPDRKHAIIVVDGRRMLYRHDPAGAASLVREWQRHARPMWNPDSTRVVVIASDTVMEQWLESFRIQGDKLTGGRVITENVGPSLDGAKVRQVTALKWDDDATSIHIAVTTSGDEAAFFGLYRIRAEDGQVLERIAETLEPFEN
ncbi:hypothetical protein ACFLQU_02560 [Verrucomicrobiota bacterium]